MEMVPYHKLMPALVNGMVTVARLPDSDVLIPPERGCGNPVLFLYAPKPTRIFL
jgi:hypothetical protein